MKTHSIVYGMTLIMLIAGFPLFAQGADEQKPEYGWQKELVGGLNFTQTAFDNWSQGGENTLAWQLNINGSAEKSEEKCKWDGKTKISYGMAKLAGLEARKSIDELKLESVFAYLLGAYVNPYVAASAETEFSAGYEYSDDGSKVEISNLLDPGYFGQGAGIGYEPIKEFKTRLGFALREGMTRNHAVPYTDDPETKDVDETKKIEAGLESVTDFKRRLFAGILLTSRLAIFSNMKGLMRLT